MSKKIIAANCCGNCTYSNRPRKPEDHEAHYMVSKTQRWCYLHKMRCTRECVCENFELEVKRGGVPAIKRVLKFNERATRIKQVAQMMKDKGLKTINFKNMTLTEIDGWLFHIYGCSYTNGAVTKVHTYHLRDDDNAFDKYEKELREAIENYGKEI